jgi:lupus La protein
LSLISDKGWPSEDAAGDRKPQKEEKKRKADDSAPEEREILYDGVRFTAKRTGGEDGSIEIVEEDKVGTAAGQWPVGKLFRFVISKKDGTFDGSKEEGERFNHIGFKEQLAPIAKPAFVGLDRPVAPLPSAAMAVDTKPSEFPARLTAPPTIGTASAAPPVAGAKSETSSYLGNGTEFPAKGQASFRELVSDEDFEKIKGIGTWEGRKIEWVRASGTSLCLPCSLSTRIAYLSPFVIHSGRGASTCHRASALSRRAGVWRWR